MSKRAGMMSSFIHWATPYRFAADGRSTRVPGHICIEYSLRRNRIRANIATSVNAQ